MNVRLLRARVSVLSTVLAAVALLGIGSAVAIRDGRIADRSVEAAEARYARLVGLAAARRTVEESLAAATATVERHAFPAAIDSNRIAVDLQSVLRHAATEAGMVVTGSQILPVRAHEGFEEIPVSLTLQASLEQLQLMLVSLAKQRPVILADSLTIHPVRGPAGKPGQSLVVQLTLSVMRTAP